MKNYKKIRDFKAEGFRLEMFDTETRDSRGKWRLAYRFSHNGTVIFEGADFHCSPQHAVDSDRSAGGLLSFLALQKGDTDEDYFENYTPAQMEFSEQHGENLSIIAMELEERDADADTIGLELEETETE